MIEASLRMTAGANVGVGDPGHATSSPGPGIAWSVTGGPIWEPAGPVRNGATMTAWMVLVLVGPQSGAVMVAGRGNPNCAGVTSSVGSTCVGGVLGAATATHWPRQPQTKV